jgi:16S rRNA (guanine966-N2)-methyltransferase
VKSLRASQQRLAATMLRVEAADGLAYMRRAAPASYELVFLDPPFDAGIGEPALTAAAPLVVADGFVYVEAAAPVEEAVATRLGLRLHRHGRAGSVHFHLLQRSETPARP